MRMKVDGGGDSGSSHWEVPRRGSRATFVVKNRLPSDIGKAEGPVVRHAATAAPRIGRTEKGGAEPCWYM